MNEISVEVYLLIINYAFFYSNNPRYLRLCNSTCEQINLLYLKIIFTINDTII